MDTKDIITALMQDGKGMLLSGESNEVEDERLAAFGAASEEARKSYRELLISTPGIEEHLSGIILASEAVRETDEGGAALPGLIASKGMLAGVAIDPAETPDDKLPEALAEHSSRGISFVLFAYGVSVSDEPVSDGMQEGIRSLALHAKAAIAAGVVPVIAVDVSMYGSHAASQSEDMIVESLSLLSDSLKGEEVNLGSVIIGVSMAVSGSDSPARADAAEVAERTVRAATTAVPPDVGGMVFLSDAQNPEEATANLNALARLEPLPWPIAFCFSRALQDPVLAAWKGSDENLPDAQEIFVDRLTLLSRADAAGYSSTLEEH